MIIDLIHEATVKGYDPKLLELLKHLKLIQHPEPDSATNDVIELLVNLNVILGGKHWALRAVPPSDHKHQEHFQVTLRKGELSIDRFMEGSVDESSLDLDRSYWNYLLMWVISFPLGDGFVSSEVKDQVNEPWETTGEILQKESAYQLPLRRTA